MKTENVWDYPRPPALEPAHHRIRIVVDGVNLVDTTSAYRILETSHPPVYYFPKTDVKMACLLPAPGSSFCEWKGRASYWTYQTPTRVIESVAWSYPVINGKYEAIADHLAFYPSKVDECWVDEERAQSQAGDFYGGWITSNLTGPFKGGPGTMGW